MPKCTHGGPGNFADEEANLEVLQLGLWDEWEQDVALNGGAGSPIAVAVGNVCECQVVVGRDAARGHTGASPVVPVLQARIFLAAAAFLNVIFDHHP